MTATRIDAGRAHERLRADDRDAGGVRPRRSAGPSNTSVLPASIDSAVAPTSRITSIVATPTTGTSNRMS